MSNTSGRVRKPPGGDSSFNIFGISNEPKKATESNDQKATDNNTQKATGTEELQVNTDDVVVTEEEASQKAEDANDDGKEKKDVEAEEEKNEKEIKDSVDQNSTNAAPVDVKDSPAKSENQNTPENKKNKQRGAYNPITGEPYGSLEKTETPKSVGQTRVRQPPGGASSKLW